MSHSERLEVGQIVRARVTTRAPYGLWMDHDGKTILVLIPDLSWFPPVDPFTFAKDGDELVVKILLLDERSGSYRATIRDLRPEENPWRDPTIYAVGSHHEGQVSLVVSYGVWVRLTTGVEGVILGANLAGGELRQGDRLSVVVTGLDPGMQSIELALRPIG